MPWGRSGSHGGSQGHPGPPTCPKTTFEAPLGPPLWVTIFGTFFDFAVFFLHVFFEGRFGGLPGAI